MFVKRLESRFLAVNTYVVACEISKQAAVIDPVVKPEFIMAVLEQNDFKLRHVINTHGHIDHVWRNGQVKKATGATIMIHESDSGMLTKPRWFLLPVLGRMRPSPPADVLLRDGDVIELGLVRLEVIHTPGHTPGGICLRYKKHLFTGDTLFAGGIGRVDMKGGSLPQILESIKDKLLILSDDIAVHPGHGPESTIAAERLANPFLRASMKSLENFMLPRRKRSAETTPGGAESK